MGGISGAVVCRNFIDGNFEDSPGNMIEVISPLTGASIGSAPESSLEQVDRAVVSADAAYSAWSQKTYKQRAQYLFRLRELITSRLEALAETVSNESGKTIAEAKAGILKGIEVIEFALSLQNKLTGTGVVEVSQGVFCQQMRTPMGVTVGITPFNFPAMVPMWLFPISLACGNSFIWKPSEKVPLTAQMISELVVQAGFPPGVFQTIHGGKEVVSRLIESDKTRVIAFVGSTPVARSVYEQSAKLGKRSLCLGGAKNHIILLPDADEKLTVQGVVDSFTGCAGQRCMAASVLLAVGSVDKIITKIAERARGLELGKTMGAIIDEHSYKRIKAIVANARLQGAEIVLDGTNAHPPQGCEGGFWIGPTIIDHATEDMQCVREEIFGPVLTVCRVKTLDDAVKRENDHPYGNAVSVFTGSGTVAEFVVKNASAGMVGVNVGVPVPREPFSFGGRKLSKFGQGDITGDSSVALWTDIKKVTTKWHKLEKNNWMS